MLGTTAAVVLNFRTAPLAIRLVQSLQRRRQAVGQIILVDNASGDGSADRCARELPDVHLIVSGENGGFSAGCNLGIRAALDRGAGRVLVLNSDVMLEDDAIERLTAALDERPSHGIVGPMLVSTHGDGRVESRGIRFTRWSGRMRHPEAGAPREHVHDGSVQICDGVSGCAMLVRREVFEAVGLFDEDYFYGFEDLDFCLRAKSAGFMTACVGSAVAVHEGQASIGRRAPRRIYFAARNHLLLAARCARPAARLARWVQTTAIVGLNLGHALFRSTVPRRDGLSAVLSGIRDFKHGRWGSGEDR